MISTFLTLYAAGTLMTNDLPTSTPHVMPWNENVLLETTAVPEKREENIAPFIEAKAAIVVDLNNGLILYEKNIYEPLPIASLTKLMTTTIILEENDPTEVVTVSKNVSQTPGSKIWLAEGEKITVENLLYASLINSANDAAMALAEHNSGSIEAFVTKMNNRAQELGLINTTFINPTGLDEDAPLQVTSPTEKFKNPISETTPDKTNNTDKQDPSEESESDAVDSANTNLHTTLNGSNILSNYSTAYDLTLLGRYAYGKSFVRRAVTKKELEIASTNEVLTHKLKNTNELLDSYLNVLGLKTGTTDEAGECLIAIIENEDGNNILTIVLNSPARYTETKLLADWTFRTYIW